MSGKNVVTGKGSPYRRAAVLVWTACSLTTLVGFTALAVDMGYTYAVRGELQRTADAAAMAAASGLGSDTEDMHQAAYDLANEYAGKNSAAGTHIQLSSRDVELGRAVPNDGGMYDFEADDESVNAVRVTVRMTAGSPNGTVPLFFGRVFGLSQVEMSASAVAMLVPRDIAVVIDLSNSMSYDSQLKHESETEINIRQVWEDLGSPTFGKMTTFHDSADQMPKYSTYSEKKIKEKLGLDKTAYPYPTGSWGDYVNYVKNGLDDSWRDPDERRYADRYGLRTWVHYLLDQRHLASETPALAGCRVQPFHSLKQAVETLADYLAAVDGVDQLALVSYDETGRVDEELTSDYSAVTAAAYAQQAGGYGSATNISNGIQRARQELTGSRARSNAKKVIILLTDGHANRPHNADAGRQAAINSAQHAVDADIQIYTISLGSSADQDLMIEMAEMGGGEHFHVPTVDISQYEQALQDVFRTLGGKRPVQLIR